MSTTILRHLDALESELQNLRHSLEDVEQPQLLPALQALQEHIEGVRGACSSCELRSKSLEDELSAHQEELKAQDEALSESQDRRKELEQYLDAIFRQAPMGYLVLETSLEIRDHNHLARELLAPSVEELSGCSVLSFFAPLARGQFRQACSRALRQRERQSLELQPSQDAAAGQKRLQAEIVPLELVSEDKTLLLCSLLDTSTRHRTHSELLEAKVRLEREVAGHKLTQQQLQRQEARFRQLIAENADALLVVAQDGHVLFANPAAEFLLGEQNGGLTGVPLGFTIVPSEIEIEQSGETPPRVAELRYSEIEWEGQPARLVSMRDITARKQAEEQLKLAHDALEERVRERTWELEMANQNLYSEMAERMRTSDELQRIQKAVESSGDAIIIAYSLEQADYCNPATEALFGYNLQALNQGGGLAALYRASEELEALRQALDAGESFSGEVFVRTREGESMPVLLRADVVYNDSGEITSLVAIHKDVTEIHKARDAMLASREEFRNLADNLPDMVARIDKDLCYTFANRALAEAWGHPGEEAYGLCLRDMELPDEIQTLWISSLEEVLEKGVVRDFEFSYSDEGRTNYYHSRIAPEFDHRGDVVSCVSLSSNVTARVEMERELRQSQKMEALGAMAGKVAHDFNNMLGVIMTSAELLHSLVLEMPAEAQRRVQRILEASNQAKNIISRMLSFSRMDQPAKSHLDLESEVRKALALLQDGLPPSITLHYHCESAGLMAWVDSTQLQQIIMNLGLNARDALVEKARQENRENSHAETLAAGSITVSLDSLLLSASETSQQFPDLEPGWYGRLTISDTGTGIATEDLERIFDPFFTTKGKGKGTGLGLSMTHRILRSHQGAVRVMSEPGHGTVFTIYLPLSGQSVQDLAREEELPEAVSATVLLVDDEPAFLESVQETLENYGCSVLSASNALAALQLLEQVHKQERKVDLLFTDQSMPGMAGTELISRVREILPGLPVVLTTGFSDYLTTERTRRLRAVFLAKPFSSTQLLRAVAKALSVKDVS